MQFEKRAPPTREIHPWMLPLMAGAQVRMVSLDCDALGFQELILLSRRVLIGGKIILLGLVFWWV